MDSSVTGTPARVEEAHLPPAPARHRRELTLRASRNALPADFTRIIPLIEVGRLDTRPWITHGAKFDDMTPASGSSIDPATAVIKAIVEV